MNVLLRRLAIVLLPLAVLSACGGMSKSDCEQADWRELGRRDAEQGQPASPRFAQRAEACRQAGAGTADEREYRAGHAAGLQRYCTPQRGHDDALAGRPPVPVCEQPAYLAGHGDGLRRFCTARNGFEHGRHGHAYRQTCPPAMAHAFQTGYRMGQELHELNRRLDRIESQQSHERKLLDDPKTTGPARDAANRRLGQLDGDEAVVRRLIRQAEADALGLLR